MHVVPYSLLTVKQNRTDSKQEGASLQTRTRELCRCARATCATHQYGRHVAHVAHALRGGRNVKRLRITPHAHAHARLKIPSQEIKVTCARSRDRCGLPSAHLECCRARANTQTTFEKPLRSDQVITAGSEPPAQISLASLAWVYFGTRKQEAPNRLVWDQCLLASDSSFREEGKDFTEKLTTTFSCASRWSWRRRLFPVLIQVLRPASWCPAGSINTTEKTHRKRFC